MTFTAVVSAVSPGAGTPTGVVTFDIGGTSLGTGTLSAGQASFTTSSLPLGGGSITASYGGNTDFSSDTSSALAQTVGSNSSSSVVASVSPALFGQSVTFTDTVSAVSPITGTPTGSVGFYDAGTLLASVSLSAGQAAFATSSLSVGTHTITADYAGAGTFTGSTGSASETVNQDATTTTLTSGTNPSIHDHSVTYTTTVAVSGTGTGTPGGSVALMQGTTTLGSATLTSGSATFSISSIAVGTDLLTADYLGATDYATSNSSTLSQVVQANTVSVTADTVTATAGVSTGSIAVGTFTDNDPTLTSASSFTATIYWGDGSSSTGTVTTGSGSTFDVSGSHTYAPYGSFTTTVSVTDTYNGVTGLGSNTATVGNPIVITNPVTLSNYETDTVSQSITATDARSGTFLTYTSSPLPAGLSLDTTSGVITGTVALGDATYGPYSITVGVTDGTYSNAIVFTWDITNAIALTNPGNQTSTENASVTLPISASDSVSGSTLAYSALGLPPGLKINSGTGAITGTVALGSAAGGPYNVIVTASDGTYSTSQAFTWTVLVPITMTNPGPQTTIEGRSGALTISATDNVSGNTLAFTALGLPPGLSIDTATGAITGTVAVGAAQDGPYTVTVEAGDGTYSISQSFTWNVINPVAITVPADQTNNEGDTVALTIRATDSTSGTVTYGAIGLPGGLSINSSTGAITGTVATGDAANGPYTVTLMVSDGTYSNRVSFEWNVICAVSLTAPADQTNNAGDSVSLQVVASDSISGTTLAFSATGLPSGLSINSSTGVISGTITAGGSSQPTVTASDGTYSASQSFNWNVSSTITITDAGPQVYNAGDSVVVPITATDTASGTLVFSASGLLSGLSISSSTGTISGTISSSLTPGSYTTTVSVTDGTNTAVDTFGWTIDPVSAVTVTSPGNQSNTEGDTVSLSISASDSGSGTLVYGANGLPPGLSIDPATGVISGTITSGASGLGPFTTTVTATDGTNSDQQTFTWTIGGPIALTNPGTQTSTEGASVSLSLSASYSGSGSLVYAAVDLPPGLAINPGTGAITGTIGAGAAANGPYFVAVSAAVGAYASSQFFTWNVGSPITITAPGDQTTNEGSTVSLSISATDSISGSTLVYSATGLPAGLAIAPSTAPLPAPWGWAPRRMGLTPSPSWPGMALTAAVRRLPGTSTAPSRSPSPPIRPTTKATRCRCRCRRPIRSPALPCAMPPRVCRPAW